MFGNAQKTDFRSLMLQAARETSGIARKVLIKENGMSIGLILLIILVLALVGVIPTWPHSSGWGYGPSGGIGLILLIVLVLVVLGRI
jgi:drug/metabolite transporter superfamily protein YnfA